jgi:hypothetical protein
MNYKLLRRLIFAKLCEKNTYILALIVGTLINVYGQLLVPWFRGVEDPSTVLLNHYQTNPWLTLISIFLAFAFPLCVGVYSAVSARYKNRRTESVADFPDTKPDPVFRVNQSGQFVEVGTTTQKFFGEYTIHNAQSILGDDIWGKIKSGIASDAIGQFQFEPEGAHYIVKYSPTRDDKINIYLTRL